MRTIVPLLATLSTLCACESRLTAGRLAAPHTVIADAQTYDVRFHWSPVPGARYVVYVSSSPGVTTGATRIETAGTSVIVAPDLVDTPCARVAAVVGGKESELSAEACGQRNLGAFGPEPIWSASAGPQSLRGAAVAVGDLDGDGWADLAVGEPGWDDGLNLDTGRVTIHLGRAPGPSSAAWELRPGIAGMEAGAALVVGDYDKDGVDDLFVGAPGSGEVLGFRGRAGAAPDSAATWTYSQPAVTRFGAALAFGPGTMTQGALLFVGAPADPGIFIYREEAGFVRGLDSVAGSELGAALAVGDLDGDDQLDLVAGAPAEDGSGVAYVYMDATGPALKLTETDAGARFGSSVGVGRTLEGTPAVLVSAPDFGSTDQGRIACYLPDGTGGYAVVETWDGSYSDTHQGLAMLPFTVDIDRNDVPDVVYSTAFGGISWCEVRDEGLNCLIGYVGGPEAHGFGSTFAPADFNGDGRLDFAVGAPSAPEGSPAVSVFAGAGGAPRAIPGHPLTVRVGEPARPVQAAFDDALDAPWVRCRWNWGDGTPETLVEPCHPATAGSVTHAYEVPGTYPLRLRVEANGRFGEGVTTVTVR